MKGVKLDMVHPLTPLTQQNNAFNQLEKVFYE